MEKFYEDEVEFIKELDEAMVNPYDFTKEERELVIKLVKLGYIKAEKTAGFNNYYYKLTEKGRKELKL